MVNSNNGEGFRLVGRVLRPHGVRGEFVVFIESDFPEWLAKRPTFYVPKGRDMAPWQVLSARYSGQKLIMRVAELADRTAVETARDTPLYLPDSEARCAVNDPDFFFNSDLVGCEVFDHREGRVLGTVKTVLEMPAQNLLEVLDGHGPAILIPFTAPIIGDIHDGRIEVHLPEGLLACFQETGQESRQASSESKDRN